MGESEDYFGYVAIRWVQECLGVTVPTKAAAVSLLNQHYPGGYPDFKMHLIEGLKV